MGANNSNLGVLESLGINCQYKVHFKVPNFDTLVAELWSSRLSSETGKRRTNPPLGLSPYGGKLGHHLISGDTLRVGLGAWESSGPLQQEDTLVAK